MMSRTGGSVSMDSMGSRPRRSSALIVVPLAMLGAACGSTSSQSTPGATNAAQHGITRIASQRVPGGIGTTLVSGQGRTLYVFLPEKGGKVRCVGGCANTWPPLLLRAGSKPTATSVVHPKLVGTVANPAGGTIITYAGWPLHTYASDTSGSHKGQGSGGQWYMISPSGTVITKPVNARSGGSSSSAGSNPY
jgi:predicted lipoprotein with Yx(FWY)xxD motif